MLRTGQTARPTTLAYTIAGALAVTAITVIEKKANTLRFMEKLRVFAQTVSPFMSAQSRRDSGKDA
jgi:hypothetical protein